MKKKPPPGSQQRSNTRAIGTRAERRALRHYRLRGYRVLATNRWIGGYELDLVLRRGRAIVFCEVKSKAGPERGDPLEMVTPEKVRRLRQAAKAWLAANPQPGEFELRFDVVADRTGRLEVVADAF
ncbi:MAG TPA: YraN family protein [Gaiellaceae bacterium]|nr:YraN family protein [Gaiellaceae bacterium]